MVFLRFFVYANLRNSQQQITEIHKRPLAGQFKLQALLFAITTINIETDNDTAVILQWQSRR